MSQQQQQQHDVSVCKPSLQPQGSLEECTSLNPKDYVWGNLTSVGQQKLFGQFMQSSMQSSMSLLLALQFPPGGFASWAMLHGPRPPVAPHAAGAASPAKGASQPAVVPPAAVASSQIAPQHGANTNALPVSAKTGSSTKVRKQEASVQQQQQLPPAKLAKTAAAAKTLPPAAAPPAPPSKAADDQQYAMEPLGLDDICKLFDADQMGSCFTVDGGFKVCPTSSLCSDPLPYAFDQDFCMDGLLDIESVMAEMSNQCSGTALDMQPAEAAAAADPVRSSARQRSKATAKKAKGSSSGSFRKAGACQGAFQHTAAALQAAT